MFVWTLLWSHVVLFILHSIALLWPSEWDVISRLFIVDQPISIHCFKQTTPTGPTTQYTTQPGKSAKPEEAVHLRCKRNKIKSLFHCHELTVMLYLKSVVEVLNTHCQLA